MPAGSPAGAEQPLQGSQRGPYAPEQLLLGGGAAPVPLRTPRSLTERQRDLLRWVRWHGSITTREARRWYVDPSGACGRLVELGLLERQGRGTYVPRPGGHDDEPASA